MGWVGRLDYGLLVDSFLFGLGLREDRWSGYAREKKYLFRGFPEISRHRDSPDFCNDGNEEYGRVDLVGFTAHPLPYVSIDYWSGCDCLVTFKKVKRWLGLLFTWMNEPSSYSLLWK